MNTSTHHTEAIEAGEWPERQGKARILVENPDAVDLSAHAKVLRDAGYDVATCSGPVEPGKRLHHIYRVTEYFDDHEHVRDDRAAQFCPLVAEGHCSLASGADVVVSTTSLPGGETIATTIASMNGAPTVVLEGPQSTLATIDEPVQGLPFPVTEDTLVAAVEKALAT